MRAKTRLETWIRLQAAPVGNSGAISFVLCAKRISIGQIRIVRNQGAADSLPIHDCGFSPIAGFHLSDQRADNQAVRAWESGPCGAGNGRKGANGPLYRPQRTLRAEDGYAPRAARETTSGALRTKAHIANPV